MSHIRNSDLLKHILKKILYVTGRRATEYTAFVLIKTIIDHLEQRYDFLTHIEIKSTLYHEDTKETTSISAKHDIESVSPAKIAKSIESIVRILCTDLREESGLFFVKELKSQIGDNYLAWIRNHGVDLDIIQLEHHYVYRQRKRKKHLSEYNADPEHPFERKIGETSVLDYTWKNVGKWEFKNNVCFLYDKKGKMIDKLHLDKIVENHIKELTEFDEKLTEIEESLIQEEIKISDKQHEFLRMLYSRDLDVETALYVMRVSDEELDYIIRRLAKLELVTYIAHDVVEITQKGIDYILAEKKERN